MASLSDLLALSGGGSPTPANPLFNVTPVSANARYSADPSSFVTGLYQNDLMRNPDPQGLAYWVSGLQNPATQLTPAKLEQAFQASPEYYAAHPQAQAQQNWLAQARAATQGLNATPFVMDPTKLSTDPAKNQTLMYKARPTTDATNTGTPSATDPNAQPSATDQITALQQQVQQLQQQLASLQNANGN